MEQGRVNQGNLDRNLIFPLSKPSLLVPTPYWSSGKVSSGDFPSVGSSLLGACYLLRWVTLSCQAWQGHPPCRRKSAAAVVLGVWSRSASTKNLLAPTQGFPQSYSTRNSGLRSSKSV